MDFLFLGFGVAGIGGRSCPQAGRYNMITNKLVSATGLANTCRSCNQEVGCLSVPLICASMFMNIGTAQRSYSRTYLPAPQFEYIRDVRLAV